MVTPIEIDFEYQIASVVTIKWSSHKAGVPSLLFRLILDNYNWRLSNGERESLIFISLLPSN